MQIQTTEKPITHGALTVATSCADAASVASRKSAHQAATSTRPTNQTANCSAKTASGNMPKNNSTARIRLTMKAEPRRTGNRRPRKRTDSANRRWLRRLVRRHSDTSIQNLLNMPQPEMKSRAALLRLLQYQALAAHYLQESKTALSRYNQLLNMASSHALESHKLCLAVLGLSDQTSAGSSKKKESSAYIYGDVDGGGVMSPNEKS